MPSLLPSRRGAVSRQLLLAVVVMLFVAAAAGLVWWQRGGTEPAPVAGAEVVAPAPPRPTPPPAPTPTPSPFGKPVGPVEEAPPAVAVAGTSPSGESPWTFLLEPEMLDMKGNPIALGGSIEVIALGPGGTPGDRFVLTPGQPTPVTLAEWPRGLAIGGTAPDAMVARAVVQVPPLENMVGPLAARAEIDFFDPEQGMLDRAGQLSRATGQAGWMERFARDERVEVMFSGDVRPYPVVRRDLAVPTPWETDDPSHGPRTLRLELVVRVSYFGRIEAAVTEALPDDAVAATVVAVGPEGEAPPAADEVARTEQQRARRAGDPIDNVVLDRPYRGGRGPQQEDVPEAVARELRAGAEPMAFRLSQRAFVMEQTPVIDADRVTFPRVPPGRYVLEVVTKKGMVGRSQPFDVVELETARVTIPVASGTTLEVTVTSREGEAVVPVEGAEVVVRGQGGGGGRGGNSAVAFRAAGGRGEAPGAGRSGTTDRDGRVLLTALEPGRVELVVRHQRFAEARRPVVLAPGANAEAVELFRDRARVEFRVVSTDGHDVPQGTVSANRQRRFFGRGRAEEQAEVKMGRARLDLDYGVWVFTAEAGGFARTTLSEMAIEDPGPHEVTISLPPRLDVTIRLSRRGAPAAATPVTLFSRAESTFGPSVMTTDDAGVATYQVAPGDYAVYVSNRFLETIDVTVDGSNVFDIEMKPVTVDGYLVSASDKSPIERARVRLVAEVAADDPSFTIPSVFRDPRAQSNAEGYYRMPDVDEGLYRLEVTARGFASLITDPMELNAETVQGPMRHELSPLQGSIEGKITRPDGAPVAGVFIRQALNEEGVPYPINFREVISNDEGSYRMSGLEPGLYLLQFAGQPWRGMNYLPHTSPVLDVTGEEPLRYDFVMVPGGSARFSVRDAEGVAVGGVRLALIDDSGASVSTPYVESPDPVSDVVGEFHWTELRAGTYRVVASRDGWSQAEPGLTVTVEPDRTVRVTVVMTRL